MKGNSMKMMKKSTLSIAAASMISILGAFGAGEPTAESKTISTPAVNAMYGNKSMYNPTKDSTNMPRRRDMGDDMRDMQKQTAPRRDGGTIKRGIKRGDVKTHSGGTRDRSMTY